ncbi:hypothetical protein QQF64_031956, partial [Cirrhinus molitorella]
AHRHSATWSSSEKIFRRMKGRKEETESKDKSQPRPAAWQAARHITSLQQHLKHILAQANSWHPGRETRLK